MPKEGYFTINAEIDFRLTQFSVLTNHIGWCKMISWNPFTPKQTQPKLELLEKWSFTFLLSFD